MYHPVMVKRAIWCFAEIKILLTGPLNATIILHVSSWYLNFLFNFLKNVLGNNHDYKKTAPQQPR